MGTRDLQETEGGRLPLVLGRSASQASASQFGSSRGRVRVAGTCEGRMLRCVVGPFGGIFPFPEASGVPRRPSSGSCAPWLSALVQDCCRPVFAEPARAHPVRVPAASLDL